MTLIPNAQNLFVVDLHYTVTFDDIEPALDAHMEFLEAQFDAGCFIAAGPKVPRTGGVILATAPSLADLMTLLEGDPFKQQDLARYTVTEFRPTTTAPQLAG